MYKDLAKSRDLQRMYRTFKEKKMTLSDGINYVTSKKDVNKSFSNYNSPNNGERLILEPKILTMGFWPNVRRNPKVRYNPSSSISLMYIV